MGYAAGLAAAAAIIWACLSGRGDDPVTLGFGVMAASAAVLTAKRMHALDEEGAPYMRVFGIIGYAGWLLLQIAKSNIAVAAKVLSPRSAIAPTLVRYRTQTDLDLSRVMLANSITLTPGTVTIEIEEDAVLVHVLDEHQAGADLFATMERRILRALGREKGR